MSFNLLEAEDLQEARSKNAGLMMFYVAGMGGVLCYNISPKKARMACEGADWDHEGTQHCIKSFS
ncbi:hypothetical protein SLEP1_g19812 [Rubroshorea leprosula]|uniref:Uncharacterized protein n=1 Tax=Rubroshorea leprosula TaxID=152421 RepID=A0AAV5J630_9ROSI|nr:hypothetical protein SLEP1_g19812 [Rubroshorea leprosula]